MSGVPLIWENVENLENYLMCHVKCMENEENKWNLLNKEIKQKSKTIYFPFVLRLYVNASAMLLLDHHLF